MSRRGLTLVLAGSLTVLLGVLAALLPVPYVVLVPGPVTDTLGTIGGKPVISVGGARSFPPTGHLYLTTVGVVPGDCDAHPTLLQALRAWFDHEQAVEPHQVICPPGETSDAVKRQNEQEMTQSQRDAITAALLELDYRPTSTRLLVGSINDQRAPAARVLQPGDAILRVDGVAVTEPQQLRQRISSHRIGDVVALTIERDGHRRDVRVRTVDAGDGTHRPVIGIALDRGATFDGVRVKIGLDPREVGGPSAGLAFSLGIVDKLTPGDLTGGRVVASTGTIDGFGQVGPIGGIQQKIAAAARANAAVFLTPAGDCADARSVAPDSMTLVRVDTLHTAVAALRAIASGSRDYPRC